MRAALLGTGAAVALSLPAAAGEIDELRSEIQALQEKIARIEATDRQESRRVAPAAAVEAGSKPKSWVLPGSNTSMVIGGYTKLDLIYDINGNNGDGTGMATIPLDGSAAATQQGNTRLHARQSRLWVKTWTPTDWGELATHIEGDFFGAGGSETTTNSTGFRIRHAYGTLGPVLAGQTFSNFIDNAALPETIDTGGPAGNIAGVRQAQIRYTHAFGNGMTLAVAAENPETAGLNGTGSPFGGAGGGFTSVGTGSPDPIPDFTAQAIYRWATGHVSVSGLARWLNSDTGAVATGTSDDGAFGWGLSTGASWRVIPTTAIGGNIYGGRGFGRYNAGYIPDAVVELDDLDPVAAVGGVIWGQHKWTDTLRSNLALSAVKMWTDDGFTGAVPAGVNELLWSSHVNLIWSPVPQVNFGVEYIHGFRNANGPNGTLDRIQVGMQYNF